jgi:hypothetical protein
MRRSQSGPSTWSSTNADVGTAGHGPILLRCTVCSKIAKNAYGWRRHEAQHFKPWACMPADTHLVDDCCAICGDQDTSYGHRQTHYKLDHCLKKPLASRSFRGRDKLSDHLRTHLGPQTGTDLPQASKARRNDLVERWEGHAGLALEAIWCGFCMLLCDSWTARQEHILKHLRNGVSLEKWEPMR